MKHYTTIEQSKKLVELGLNPETADMFYSRRPTGKSEYSVFPDFKPEGRLEVFTKVDLPCWSVGALMKLINGIITEDAGLLSFMLWNHYEGWSIQCELLGYNHSCSTSLETVYDTVIWLLENGYIKKEK